MEILPKIPDPIFLKDFFKEYCKIPSSLLRELKGFSKLPRTARDIYEVLFDLSKFDACREVKISINKICNILNCARSTAEGHLRNLEKSGFINRLKNYSKIGSQLINTYKVLIPNDLLNLISKNTKLVSIKPDNPITKTANEQAKYNPFEKELYEEDEEDFSLYENDLNEANTPDTPPPPAENCGPFNYPKDNNINNCCFLNNSKGDQFVDNFIDLPLETDKEDQIKEYYPAKQKPETLRKTVLRHILQRPIKFEATIREHITKAQEYVIQKIVNFWSLHRYVSSPTNCFEWIRSMLLNPNALSKCGNNFLQKINTINKMIRERRFTKPFTDRYRSRDEYRTARASYQSIESPEKRLSAAEREKAEKIVHLTAQIENIEKQLNSPETLKDEAQCRTLLSYIQNLNFKIQEIQYA